MAITRKPPDMEAITRVFRQLGLTEEKDREVFRQLSNLGHVNVMEPVCGKQQEIRSNTGEGAKNNDA